MEIEMNLFLKIKSDFYSLTGLKFWTEMTPIQKIYDSIQEF